MTKELTVTIDQELIAKAERYAQEQGVSLWELVESSLQDVIGRTGSTFSQRWRGRFRPADQRNRLITR